MGTTVAEKRVRAWSRVWGQTAASEGALLLVFVVLTGSYILRLPSFEGPDESEHCPYVQAYAANASVHPLDPKSPLRWGYQIHHPPLYYWLVGQYAKITRPTFHGTLVANPKQNDRFPFLRHDSPGQRFPFDDVNRGLRILRLPSLVFGVLTFLAVLASLRLLLPDSPHGRVVLLAGAMLCPNTLQLFSTVINDGLLLLLSCVAMYAALRVVRATGSSQWWFLVTGLALGLGFWTKMTVFIPTAVVGSLWVLDAIGNRRWRVYGRGMLFFAPPLFLLAGAYLLENAILYRSPTREYLLWLLTRSLYREAAAPVTWIVGRMADGLPGTFLADLCWQTVRVDAVSRCVFWPWLVLVLASAAMARDTTSRPPRWAAERLVSVLCVLWGMLFIIAANRHWANIQFRHAWCVFPFMLPGAWLAGQRLWLRVRGVGWRPMAERGRALPWTMVAVLVVLNAYLLVAFGEFLRPSSDRHDRDYQTYLYCRVLNRNRAQAYLWFGNFLTADYLEAFEQRRWQDAVDLSQKAEDQGQWPTVAQYVRAFSLHALGRTEEAHRLVAPLSDSYPPAFPLYARTLADLGKRDEAQRYIETVLPSAKPHEARELRSLLDRLQAPSASPPNGPGVPPPVTTPPVPGPVEQP